MTALKSIRITITSLWVMLLGQGVSNYFLQPKLPAELLTAMQNMPGHGTVMMIKIIGLIFLAVASVCLWQGKKLGRSFLVIGVLLLVATEYLFGTQAVYQWISFFDDSASVLLGVMLGLVFSKSLAKVRYLIIFSLFSILLYILNLI